MYMLSVIIIKRRNRIRNLIINFIEARFDHIFLNTFMIQPLILVFRKQVCSHYLKRKKQWAHKRSWAIFTNFTNKFTILLMCTLFLITMIWSKIIKTLIIHFIEARFDHIVLNTFMIQPLILVFRKQVCSPYLKRKNCCHGLSSRACSSREVC